MPNPRTWEELMEMEPCPVKDEHLLKQRYCWLPQQQSWIMSGEVYNFANNGANKVLELICIGEANHWNELEDPWYCVGDGDMQTGYMIPQEFKQGITIPADSPIWDAVKGAE